jgi:hypothetical protein
MSEENQRARTESNKIVRDNKERILHEVSKVQGQITIVRMMHEH